MKLTEGSRCESPLESTEPRHDAVNAALHLKRLLFKSRLCHCVVLGPLPSRSVFTHQQNEDGNSFLILLHVRLQEKMKIKIAGRSTERSADADDASIVVCYR